MDGAKFAAVGDDHIGHPLGQHAVDHVGPHHVAASETHLGMKTVDPDKGLGEVHLLDAEASERPHHALALMLEQAAEQHHLSRSVFEQMGDIAADGDDGDPFVQGQMARQHGVSAAPFDKDCFAIFHQLGGPLGEALLEQIIDVHPGIRVIGLQRHGRAVYPSEQPLFLQRGEVVAHRHLRHACVSGEFTHAHLASLMDQSEDQLVAWIHGALTCKVVDSGKPPVGWLANHMTSQAPWVRPVRDCARCVR